MRSDSVRTRDQFAKLSDRQFHVFVHLNRVEDKPYKLHVQFPTRRYKLDGKDCTAQMHGLSVRGLIVQTTSGKWIRAGEA